MVKGDCLEITLSDDSYHSFIIDKDMSGEEEIVERTLAPVIDGQELRRIKSVKLNEKINEANDKIPRRYLWMAIELKVNQSMKLTLYDVKRSITVEGDLVQQAKTQGLTEERILKQFLKVGDYPVLISDVTVDYDPNIFVPIGQLNQLRRKGLDQWFGVDIQPIAEVVLPKQVKVVNTPKDNKAITVLLKNSNQLNQILRYSIKRVYIEWYSFEQAELKVAIEACHKAGIEAYIALPRVIRHEYEHMMEILKDSLSDELDGYLVRSMDVYEYLRDFSSKPIQWDYGMSIMNNATVNYLKSLEADAGYCPSLELNRHDLNQLNTDLSEMVVYGYTNVMTSAACIRMNTTGCVKEPGKIIYIEDRKGVKVPVETVCQFCYNNIYNGVPHYLIDKMKALMSQGVGMFRLDFLNETTQTIDMLMKSAMMGEELTEPYQIDTFTRGHYNKGVE